MLALVVSFGLASTNNAAYADSDITGVRYHTTVQCGGSFLTFTTNTVLDSGSYAMLYVYDPSSGKWITDNVWQDAGAWSSFHTPDISFQPGYYSVYMSYAQATTDGWRYSGEYLDTYTQQSGYTSTTSSTCYMGN